jgi:FkbM family methyltransferase
MPEHAPVFTSYAQNFEDVILWRALRQVEQGFYIDIGAWSPDIDSVTRAFYEHGWRGINVEPNPHWYRQLAAKRARDTNLELALSHVCGTQTLHLVHESGLSTLDAEGARRHCENGLQSTECQVEVTTLAQVCAAHVPQGQAVHFLKIDVEGYEANVLRGHNWRRWRPWIVVVESTLPMSQVETHAGWEPLMLDAGYRFVYADGLNRFYLANERADLSEAFRYPPNVFDKFMLGSQQQAERSLQATYRSLSWRITKPLRAGAKLWRVSPPLFHHMSHHALTMTAAAWHAIKGASKATSRRVFLRVGHFALAHPKLHLRILALLHAQPTVGALVRRALGQGWANPAGNAGAIRHQAPDLPGTEYLSPHARTIYRQLLQQRNFARGNRTGKP